MIQKTLTFARRFNIYQRERFPVIVLAISLLPAIFSSSVVVSTHPTILEGVVALLASVAYLLHIRVIDEHRDFDHDNQHHASRPIQINTISKHELQLVDIVAVCLLIAISVTAGMSAVIVMATMLLYSYLAGKEFFIGERIRRHFFAYNGVNLVQMLLMQIFVYSIFSNSFQPSLIVGIHFLFTTVGTIVVEFIRKLKVPGDDGTGKDTYTWYLGFKNSLIIYSVFALLNMILFYWLSTMISSHVVGILILSICLLGYAYFSVILHWAKKTCRTSQMMQLSFLSMYGIFNIAIYLLSINQ